jgi:predicted metal-dependent phosphoesterase TrpH
MEITFTDDGYADFLVFGLDPEYLYHYPELQRLGLRRFRTLVEPFGCLIYQAHPFRPGIALADPALLDGVEVYNGNAYFPNTNRQAADFARRHGLAAISGSDFHHRQDLGRGGIVLPERVTDSEGLVQALHANRNPPLIETDP